MTVNPAHGGLVPNIGAMARPAPRTVSVVSKERVTPNMLRLVFGGDGLAGFGAGEFTDHYVKLKLPEPGSLSFT